MGGVQRAEGLLSYGLMYQACLRKACDKHSVALHAECYETVRTSLYPACQPAFPSSRSYYQGTLLAVLIHTTRIALLCLPYLTPSDPPRDGCGLILLLPLHPRQHQASRFPRLPAISALHRRVPVGDCHYYYYYYYRASSFPSTDFAPTCRCRCPADPDRGRWYEGTLRSPPEPYVVTR